MTEWYKPDLAYIHDVGHGDYALKSAPGILEILAQHQIHEGLIVDLGCGSGLSALAFMEAGYRVLGVDISEAMIAIARARVPRAEFRVESLFQIDIPACNGVTAIGECLNYQFERTTLETLVQLFQRIYNVLAPGGVFIFDIAEPGQVAEENAQRFTEGQDWIVLVEKYEDREQAMLTRRIITLRKIGEEYRRDDEMHHLRLYKAIDLAEALHKVGFQVQVLHSYGQYALPKAHVALIASKEHSLQVLEKFGAFFT